MRIVFVGAVDFSRHCLDEVLRSQGNVVGVLTLDKEDAGFHSDYADLSDLATTHGIPIFKIKNINQPSVTNLIQTLNPDILFVFGWSQIISKDILTLPPLGCIGTHPALLPGNRGRHPIIWALVEGLEQSGLTFFYLNEGADSGDILWQKPFPIALDDDAGSIYRKIKVMAGEAISEFLPLLSTGTAPRTPQDHSQATYWRKRTEEDGEINWGSTTLEIHNLVRALARPYVGAHTYLAAEKVIIWQSIYSTQVVPQNHRDRRLGAILSLGREGLAVRTGDGQLTIKEWQAPPGFRLAEGQQFGAKSD